MCQKDSLAFQTHFPPDHREGGILAQSPFEAWDWRDQDQPGVESELGSPSQAFGEPCRVEVLQKWGSERGGDQVAISRFEIKDRSSVD